MLLFVIGRVLKKIKSRKVIYFFIILQFSIGFLIFGIFYNIYLTVNNDYNSLLKTNKNQEFYVKADYKNSSSFSFKTFDEFNWGQGKPQLLEYRDNPFDNDIIRKLIKNHNDIDIRVEVLIKLDILSENKVKDYAICYSSDYTEVITNQAFYELTQNNGDLLIINKRDLDAFKITDYDLSAINGSTYSVKIIKSDNNIIYLPYEIYNNLYHPKNLFNTKLYLSFKDPTNLGEKLNSIINSLESNNTLYNYSINSEFFEFLNRVNTAFEESAAFNFFSCILFIIISIGLSGFFILLINTRRREIAILLTLGSTKFYIIFETYLEIAFLSFSGCTLGIILSDILLLSHFKYTYILIKLYFSSNIIMIIISLFITLLSMLPSIINISKMSPIEILRTE